MQVPYSRRTVVTLMMSGAALATLSACASIPKTGADPQARPITAYETRESFAAPVAAWPSDRWWLAYGDAQLSGLIEEALASAPDLAQAQARVAQADAIAEQMGGALSPQVGAEASVGMLKQSLEQGIPSAFVPHGSRSTGKVGLDLGWELDFFGRNRAALAAATSDAEARRADAAAARLYVSTAVAGAYADLARLYAIHDAAEEAVRVRTASEQVIAVRRARELETQAALERSHAALAASQAELAASEEALGLCRNRLAALIGKGPDRGLAIARPTPGAIRAFGLPSNLPAGLIGRRPDVVAARLTAEAAGQKIAVAKADFYPNVNLAAFVGVQSLGLDVLTRAASRTAQVGPAVTLPIFSGGRLEGAYRGARAEYALAVATYDQTLTRALEEVADSAVSAKALDKRLDRSRAALEASDAAYRFIRDRYARGLGTYLDVLYAEDALIANRRAVAELQTRAFALDVSLIRALGGGYRSA